MTAAPFAVSPPGMTGGDMKISPAVVSGEHVFVTGMTGSGPGGEMPSDPQAQFRAAFDKIGAVLAAAGSGWGSVVEMTSYHVGLQAHFDTFNAVHGAYVHPPYPAWTAVEVAGLRRAGALVEIRVVARHGKAPAP
ncbi:RidA family protein [Roseobacter sp. YSTF-M11]|uniref:RidA family protein n=1 Tax=Roseobacter insulae TaxID=2859783 RepID=A0A9X1JZK5_9RHOB|nr:RidA family protein [Roseobacter insulae]MBW4707279.1 RidA family protein [Roseobacter insulae]